jgi:hypothetical protein
MKFIASVMVILIACCQTALAQIVDTPEGKAEFVGLRHRTPEQVLEMLSKEGGEKPLHLCIATLVKLGFPAANVRVQWPGGPTSFLVTLIEPEEKARVKKRATPQTSGTFPERWHALKAAIGDGPDLPFQVAVYHYGLRLRHKAGATGHLMAAMREQFRAEPPCTVDEVARVWGVIAELDTPADFDLASWIITSDRSPTLRLAAACVLANFHDRDAAWWLLMDALRDQNDMLQDFAGKMLATMSLHVRRTVDWAPSAGAVRALLDGSCAGEIATVCQTLTRTAASSTLADRLLGDGGHLLLACAAATDDRLSTAALDLLAHLHGKPLDLQAARDWVATLNPPRP